MNIGGHDIKIGTRSKPQDQQLILRFVKEWWPNALWVDSESERSVALREALVNLDASLPKRGEFFICKDADAYRSWESSGGTEENADNMLHFICQPHELTVVIGKLEGESQRIARQLKETLLRHHVAFDAVAA